MGLLDIIFPKYCVNCKKMGEFLCSDCFSRLSYAAESICLICLETSKDFLTHPKCRDKKRIDGVFVCMAQDKITDKLMRTFKSEPYLSSLAPFLSDLMFDALIQNAEFIALQKMNFILVPIPLSKKTYRNRGYNQSELIAKELSKKFGWKTQNLLKRTKDAHRMFEVDRKLAMPEEKDIILIDDIVITGITLNKAVSVLKAAGAGKIYGVTFTENDQ